MDNTKKYCVYCCKRLSKPQSCFKCPTSKPVFFCLEHYEQHLIYHGESFSNSEICLGFTTKYNEVWENPKSFAGIF